jgi:hypothetical protein
LLQDLINVVLLQVWYYACVLVFYFTYIHTYIHTCLHIYFIHVHETLFFINVRICNIKEEWSSEDSTVTIPNY